MVLTQVDLEKVVVHPLVLLSVVDHFNRMKKIGNQKRVVGLLLGSWSSKGILDIANSFAIPFDEDDKDKEVWFLDHEYLENMYNMFRFVREKLFCLDANRQIIFGQNFVHILVHSEQSLGKHRSYLCSNVGPPRLPE